MLHFRRADAVRQRAESTMGGGVAVAANNRHARQGEALFRANDVDDALTLVALGIIFDTEILGILRKRFHWIRLSSFLMPSSRSAVVGTL